MKIIFDYNRTLFDPDTNALYPGVSDMLKRLSGAHELYLVSRFEAERLTQLEELDIAQYFQKTTFVGDKSAPLFKELVGDAKDVIVVGDSIGDEIKIGNQLGFMTIRVKQGRFSSTEPKDASEVAITEIQNVTEFERLLTFYEK